MPEDPEPGQKLDRSSFSVSERFDDVEVRRYWHSRTPAERLAQVEILRRINFGNRATERILHVFEVVDIAEKPGERPSLSPPCSNPKPT